MTILARIFTRIRVAGGLAVSQLTHHKLRLSLAIIGVALAVLATTLLAGTGIGVIDTGTQQFDSADRDLWVTAGETQITSQGGGGFENSLYNSRSVSDEMGSHHGVRHAIPLAFESVYVGTEPDGEFETFLGSGVRSGGPAVSVTEGEQFDGDPHYANGTYEGEMSHEVLIDEETAQALDIDIGDTVHVGGSLSAARENKFTVVGISPTFEQMLGTPTVTMPLSELHEVTSTTETEPATFITITVEDGASTDTVQSDLEESFPEYNIRSNDEQLQAVLQEQVLVLAAGGALVVLAVGSGGALTLNLLALIVYQQRREFAALKAQGISAGLLVATVIGQGLLIGGFGALLGVGLTPPAVAVLNEFAATVVGFEGLVQTSTDIYLWGIVIAIGIGTVAAAFAGWRVSRAPPLEYL